jgi:hypothetical protein
MADQVRRDEADRDGVSEGSGRAAEPGAPGEQAESSELSRGPSSPLGTDPQDAAPLPGDPREAQEPQEPRSSHIASSRTESETDPAHAPDYRGHADDRSRGDDSGAGAVDQLRDAWDRMRGKK